MEPCLSHNFTLLLFRSKGEQLQGSLLQVCTDCREMVLQVIRSQTTAKRFQIQQDFFANLSPNFTKDEVF